MFGILDLQITCVREVGSSLDLRVEEGDFSVGESDLRRKASLDLWSLLRVKDAQLF